LEKLRHGCRGAELSVGLGYKYSRNPQAGRPDDAGLRQRIDTVADHSARATARESVWTPADSGGFVDAQPVEGQPRDQGALRGLAEPGGD
jgi:hypothetical protein